jgi:sugar phosphate permease
MSLICLVVGIFACLIFKNKKKKKGQPTSVSNDNESTEKRKDNGINFKEMFDFTIVNNWRFLLWCAVDTLLEGAYNIPYYFLPCKFIVN